MRRRGKALRRTLWAIVSCLAIGLAGIVLAPTAFAGGGELDRSFGSNGRAVASVELAGARFFSATDVYAARAPDGGTFVAGGQIDYDEIVHFLPDGRLDSSFGDRGHLRAGSPVPYPGRGFELAGMAVDPQGRIVVAGTLAERAEILRFAPDGEPDPTFGSDGVVDSDLGVPVSKEGSRNLHVGALAIDPQGRLLLAGFYFKEYEPEGFPLSGSYLARLTPSGEPDPTFGSHGLVLETGVEGSILCESGGEVLLAGGSVRRLGADGTFDESFGDGGRVLVGPYLHIGVDGRGRILGVHTAFRLSNGHARIEVTRLFPDGTIDPGYGRQGVATFLVPGTMSKARGIAVAPDGSALITGAEVRHRRFERQGRQRAILARVNADGSIDRGFGRRGIATASYGHVPHAVGDQVLIQGRSHALVAGTVEGGKLASGEGLALFRFALR